MNKNLKALEIAVSSAYDAMLNRIGGEYSFETEFTHDCLYRYALTVEKNGLSAVSLMNLVNEEKQFGMLYDILESLSHQLVTLKAYESKITEEEEYLAEAVYSSIKEQYADGIKKLHIFKEENKMAKINEKMNEVEKTMEYRHPLCLPGETIPLKDLTSVDYDPLEEAHSMAALAIATGDEELMLKTLPNLGVYAFNAANQFYAKSVWVPGIGLVVPGTVIRFCSDGSYTGHTDPVYKSEHSDVYVVVRCSEQAAFKMLKAASIFVMSRLMTPDLVIIEDNYFYCDTEKYTFQDNWTVICPDGHIEDVESSWWRKEQCNFDYCAEATCQFQQYAMNFRSDYEFWFDLKEWYEYFDVEEV